MKKLLIPSLFLLACKPAPTPQDVAPPEPRTPKPPKVGAVADEEPVKTNALSPFVGFWSNPSCDSRTYERQIEIRDDGTVDVWDMVSPCPPKGKCVWSGIARGTGTWEAKGDTVKLSYHTVKPKTHGKVLADTLTWDGPAKAPYEEGKDAPCMYTVHTPPPKADADPAADEN